MKFKALGVGGALALSMGCSDASNVDVGADDAINSNDGADASVDGAMVVPSDGGESRNRLALVVSADRVYPNRTFAVVAAVRAGARVVVGQDITLSIERDASLVNDHASLVHGPRMQTICVGNASEDSFENRNGFLIPAREASPVGLVVVSNTPCSNGYHDSGLRLALVHTQPDGISSEVYITVTGRTNNGGQVLTANDRIQLTPTTNPAGDSLAFANMFAPTEASPGEAFPGVVFPHTTHAYGLPCMPSGSRESDAIAGCTVATNAGRAVPIGESVGINHAVVPSGTAGAFTVGREMNNIAVLTRGMAGDYPLAFTHLGGGAYLSTFRAGTNKGAAASWIVDMYKRNGESLDTLRPRVSIN